MSDQNWAKILKVFYEEDKWLSYPRSDEKTLEEIGLTEDHPLKRSGLSESDIEETISYLKDMDFIEEENKSSSELAEVHLPEEKEDDLEYIYGLSLTKDGFNVGHERELNSQRIRTNRALVVFTIALVLVGVVGNYPNTVIQKYGNVAILVILLGMIVWTDFLGIST